MFAALVKIPPPSVQEAFEGHCVAVCLSLGPRWGTGPLQRQEPCTPCARVNRINEY